MRLSMSYVAHVCDSKSNDKDRKHELDGVLLHESVHLLQWDGEGEAPVGLTEGIADWARLTCGLGAKHWTNQPGEKWDQGYE